MFRRKWHGLVGPCVSTLDRLSCLPWLALDPERRIWGSVILHPSTNCHSFTRRTRDGQPSEKAVRQGAHESSQGGRPQ